jgi:hypothetical protein
MIENLRPRYPHLGILVQVADDAPEGVDDNMAVRIQNGDVGRRSLFQAFIYRPGETYVTGVSRKHHLWELTLYPFNSIDRSIVLHENLTVYLMRVIVNGFETA